jgi:nucleotidyltransferase/DNA polymerase involved in DNA repair
MARPHWGSRSAWAATHARALVSDLDIRPSETEADAALLDQLALRAVRRWSPIAAATPPDGLWLDLTGCAHLHGGEERFCRRLRAFCERAGFTARVAVADTPGAAHAVARFGSADIAIVPTGRTVDALSGLPVAALRLAGTALVAARKFGFERVADLLPVARGPLARRLGLAAITRLDQALGAVAEPITPRTDEVMPVVERRLLEPIVTADAIVQVMEDLLGDMAELLRAKGLGVRSLRLGGLAELADQPHLMRDLLGIGSRHRAVEHRVDGVFRELLQRLLRGQPVDQPLMRILIGKLTQIEGAQTGDIAARA